MPVHIWMLTKRSGKDNPPETPTCRLHKTSAYSTAVSCSCKTFSRHQNTAPALQSMFSAPCPSFCCGIPFCTACSEEKQNGASLAGNWVTPGAVVAFALTTRLRFWSWWRENLAVCEGYVTQQVWAVLFSTAVPLLCRSQWPSGLRRRSAVDRLLVRIPPGSWMCVPCECCVLPGRGRCDGPIPRPEESYRLWCDIVCDLDPSRMRRPWPALSCCSRQKVSTNT
jgi:hypothetical protein